MGKFIRQSACRIFWQTTIIDTMILIDDKSPVCNDCVLDDEALDRSKSV